MTIEQVLRSVSSRRMPLSRQKWLVSRTGTATTNSEASDRGWLCHIDVCTLNYVCDEQGRRQDLKFGGATLSAVGSHWERS